MSYVLGISCYYHDSAVVILRDGKIVAAAQEERFTRKKHDADFPHHALAYCLREAGITPKDLLLVAFYDKPLLKFERLIISYFARAPFGLRSFVLGMRSTLRKKIWVREHIGKNLPGYGGPVLCAAHHESHAASAFFPSPFEHAAILTMDGVGEWATASIGRGEGNQVSMLRELKFPHSLGLLYSAFTYYLGFKVNSGEYKLMGLSPYGEPTYRDMILEKLLDLKQDGSFRLRKEYFNYVSGLTMTTDRFHALFGGPPKRSDEPTTERHANIARSIQEVTEEIMLRMARYAKEVTGAENLCLAGGVALNCVGNSKILNAGIFRDIWIQPAAGDAGGALGAAYVAHHHYEGQARMPVRPDAMGGARLGPAWGDAEIKSYLISEQIPFAEIPESDLPDAAARDIAARLVVGWHQDRMEFGPRALGCRSILGDARDPEMQKTMNVKIKFRESFRPFAPSVLEEDAPGWFEKAPRSPYMLLIAPIAERERIQVGLRAEKGLDKLKVIRSTLPAITHVDYSARLQTVGVEAGARYHALLAAFKKATGCPVIINTSFNVRGEPIVCTPEDAFRCFMRTNMDVLYLGRCRVIKSQMTDAIRAKVPKQEFEPD